jgi:hypothetical protein
MVRLERLRKLEKITRLIGTQTRDPRPLHYRVSRYTKLKATRFAVNANTILLFYTDQKMDLTEDAHTLGDPFRSRNTY